MSANRTALRQRARLLTPGRHAWLPVHACLRKEASMLHRLAHPRVVQLMGLVLSPTRCAIVMDFAPCELVPCEPPSPTNARALVCRVRSHTLLSGNCERLQWAPCAHS